MHSLIGHHAIADNLQIAKTHTRWQSTEVLKRKMHDQLCVSAPLHLIIGPSFDTIFQNNLNSQVISISDAPSADSNLVKKTGLERRLLQVGSGRNPTRTPLTSPLLNQTHPDTLESSFLQNITRQVLKPFVFFDTL